MVHEHLSHLKTDRRLLRRKQWISDPTVQAEIDALPDVSEKSDWASVEPGATPARTEPPAEG